MRKSADLYYSSHSQNLVFKNDFIEYSVSFLALKKKKTSILDISVPLWTCFKGKEKLENLLHSNSMFNVEEGELVVNSFISCSNFPIGSF